ncbi:MAG: hypothetical protein H7202_12995 [Pedobacter sp.]|nr:hypothetical protein [Pedobacter sp.]
MRNLKKLLPLFAFVLGLGLVFTQSAFTGKSATPTHYNNAATGMPADWQPLGSKVIGTNPGESSCYEDPSRQCLASKSGEIYTVEEFGELVEN